MAEARERTFGEKITSRFSHLTETQVQNYERVLQLTLVKKIAAAMALLPELKSSLSPEDYQKLFSSGLYRFA